MFCRCVRTCRPNTIIREWKCLEQNWPVLDFGIGRTLTGCAKRSRTHRGVILSLVPHRAYCISYMKVDLLTRKLAHSFDMFRTHFVWPIEPEMPHATMDADPASLCRIRWSSTGASTTVRFTCTPPVSALTRPFPVALPFLPWEGVSSSFVVHGFASLSHPPHVQVHMWST